MEREGKEGHGKGLQSRIPGYNNACMHDRRDPGLPSRPHWADNTRRLTSSPAQNHQTPTMNASHFGHDLSLLFKLYHNYLLS